MADFYQLMDKTCQVRRQIAERVLKGIAIRPHFAVSLENAKVDLFFICHVVESKICFSVSTG